jgi:hypothetical protein
MSPSTSSPASIPIPGDSLSPAHPRKSSKVGWGTLAWMAILALAFLVPPSARAQCTPQLLTFTVDKTTILSDGQDIITATVTVSRCGGEFIWVYLTGVPDIVFPSYSPLLMLPPDTSISFGIRPRFLAATPQTTTATASLSPGGPGISHIITLQPVPATLSISPNTITDGSGQVLTATLDTGVPVFGDATMWDFWPDPGGQYSLSTARGFPKDKPPQAVR